MKKRILSLLLACFMIASTFIISRPLVHVHAEDETGVYVKYVSALTVYNTVDGPFFLAGLDSSNNLIAVEETPKKTWGSHVGNYLPGTAVNVTSSPESAEFPNVIYEMRPPKSQEYSAVTGFKALESGTFNLKMQFAKYWSSTITLTVKVEGGEEIYSKNYSTYSEKATLELNDIALNKGENLLIIAYHVSGNNNYIGVEALEVEANYETCPHNYSNGSNCDYCGETCTHTAPAVVDGKTVCDDCGAELNLVNVKHSADISANKTVNGQFFIGALRFSDGAVRAVETTPRDTWSDAWPGNWIADWEGIDGYVTQYSEWGTEGSGSGYDPRIKFDFYHTADKTHGGLVGFTAPADGIFNIDVLLRKVGGGYPYVKVLKNDGTQLLDPIKVNGWGAEVAINLDSVALKKGEQVLIVACVGEGGKNIGFISYDVDAFYTTCPHFFGEDSKCTVCGADCTHLPTIVDKKSVCAICKAVLGSVYVQHTENLSINNTVDGQFFIGAYNTATKTLMAVETTLKNGWDHSGEMHYANWIIGHNDYASVTSEWNCEKQNYDRENKFDLLTRVGSDVKALVGFTAPEAGIFNVDAELRKINSGTSTIIVMKSDGEVLLSIDGAGWGYTYVIDIDNVQLEKGEQIYIMLDNSKLESGKGTNVGFKSFTVEAVYTECPHTDWANGECTICGADCNHEWNNGVCANCGLGCAHTVTADDATCQAAAVCATCGYTYEINPDNHAGTATKLVNNGNGTHKVLYTCCDAANETVDCVFADDDDMVCDCGYDRTVDVAEEKFADVFDSIYNGGESDYVAEAPAEDAFDNSAAVKGEDVDGFTYLGFNLEMINATSTTVKLRHHILLDGDVANYVIKVDGAAVTLTLVEGNYYYFEVEVEVGQFATAHVITVNDATVVTASVHSYMKTAFEAEAADPDAMTDAQVNLLNALYQWNKAVAEAN